MQPSWTLIGGSLGAAGLVTMFWGWLKGFAYQFAGMFVSRVQLRDKNSNDFLVYIKRHYKRLPCSHYVYLTVHIPPKDSGSYEGKPFKMPNVPVIYFIGLVPIVVTVGDTCRVLYMRWLLNFDKLLLKSHLEENLDGNRRNYVYNIRGTVNRTGLGAQDSNTQPVNPGTNAADPHSLNLPLIAEPLDPSDLERLKSKPNKTVSELLYYPKDIEGLYAEFEWWLNNKDWYSSRGLMWRRGWMICGGAGTGKSSLIRSLADRCNVPIASFALSTFDNPGFIDNWKSLNIGPCIRLIEDIDAVFDGRKNTQESKLRETLTFDTLLNTIDGVGTDGGQFLIITTNHLDKVDPALAALDHNGNPTRPGRIDRIITMREMDSTCRNKLAKRILKDWPTMIEKVVNDGHGETPAQFQERCVRIALLEHNKTFKPSTERAAVVQQIS